MTIDALNTVKSFADAVLATISNLYKDVEHEAMQRARP